MRRASRPGGDCRNNCGTCWRRSVMASGVIDAEHRRLFIGGLTAMSPRNSGARWSLIMPVASQPSGGLPEQLRDMLTQVVQSKLGAPHATATQHNQVATATTSQLLPNSSTT